MSIQQMQSQHLPNYTRKFNTYISVPIRIKHPNSYIKECVKILQKEKQMWQASQLPINYACTKEENNKKHIV